jgi:eukaryotic-like serine/threonine-protein kinase
MRLQALHPDLLRPGDMVGPWRIVRRLGVGGSGRVFKVERDGVFYALKMSLRPLSKGLGNWRMSREVAALLTYSPHPNLLRVYALDCWPHPERGYPYFVTDLVEGDDWHHWRWKTNPGAAALTVTFGEVVRTVGVLHERGVYHRDLKAENLLIRREDGRAFLIDFGNVRLPGTLAQTLGVPYGALHLLPPELMEYTRTEAWKQEVPFEGGVAADLYALGVLLYQGLTNKHPFNPELPDRELLAAISTAVPTAPHVLNPRAPRPLSDIASKLLEKRPEDRYPDTQALLRALETAEGERSSQAWQVPLLLPDEIPPEEATLEQREEEEALSQVPEVTAGSGEPSPPVDSPPPPEPRDEGSSPIRPSRRRKWLLALMTGLLLLALLSWGARSGRLPREHAPEGAPSASASSPKGSQPVPSTPQDSSAPDTPRSSLLTALLCALAGAGCPAAPVKPQPPAYRERCPEEAQHFMFDVLKMEYGHYLVTLDIHQPGDRNRTGLYREGPLLGRVERGDWMSENTPQELPVGTLLYGYLWEGFRDSSDTVNGVIAIYTKALLPDGREGPVCLWVGNEDEPWRQDDPESKPGAVVLGRQAPIVAVSTWRR